MTKLLFAKVVTLSIALTPIMASAARGDLSTLRARFEKVNPNETVTQREVLFSVVTCARSQSIESAKVSREGAELDVKVDGSCLSWKDSVSHQYFSNEHYSKLTYRISVDGKTQTQEIYVNPWDSKFTFGFDQREFSESVIGKVLAKQNPIGTMYVSDLATLKTEKLASNHIAKLQLQVVYERKSGLVDGRRMIENARNGRYAVEYSFVSENGEVAFKDLRLMTVANGGGEIDVILPESVSQTAKIQIQVQPLETFQAESSKQVAPKLETRSFKVSNK